MPAWRSLKCGLCGFFCLNSVVTLTFGTLLVLSQLQFAGNWGLECDYDLKIWVTVWTSAQTLFYLLQSVHLLQRIRREPMEDGGIYHEPLLECFNLILAVFIFAFWLYGIKPVFADGDSSCNNSTLQWGLGLWYAMVGVMGYLVLKCCCDICIALCFESDLNEFNAGESSIDPTPPEILAKLKAKTWAEMTSGSPDSEPPPTRPSPSSSQVPRRSETLTVLGVTIGMPASMQLANKPTSEENMCSICTDRFDQTDPCIALPCDRRHVFHESCVLPWLQRSQLCPCCRANVVDLLVSEGDV